MACTSSIGVLQVKETYGHRPKSDQTITQHRGGRLRRRFPAGVVGCRCYSAHQHDPEDTRRRRRRTEERQQRGGGRVGGVAPGNDAGSRGGDHTQAAVTGPTHIPESHQQYGTSPRQHLGTLAVVLGLSLAVPHRCFAAESIPSSAETLTQLQRIQTNGSRTHLSHLHKQMTPLAKLEAPGLMSTNGKSISSGNFDRELCSETFGVEKERLSECQSKEAEEEKFNVGDGRTEAGLQTKAEGAAGVVGMVQEFASSEWGPAKTAAVVAVGGLGMVAVAGLLGVDVAVAILATPGLVMTEMADLAGGASLAGLAGGAAEVAQVAETSQVAASAVSAASSLSAPGVAVVAGEAGLEAAATSIAAGSSTATTVAATTAAAGVAGEVAANSLAGGVTTAVTASSSTVAATTAAAGVAGEVAANSLAGGVTTAVTASAASSSVATTAAAGVSAGAAASTSGLSGAISSAGASVGGRAAATTLGSVATKTTAGSGLASKAGSVAPRALGGAAATAEVAGEVAATSATTTATLAELEVAGVGSELLAADVASELVVADVASELAVADVASELAVGLEVALPSAEMAAGVAVGAASTVAVATMAGSFMGLVKSGIITRIATSFIMSRIAFWGIRKLWSMRPQGGEGAEGSVQESTKSMNTSESAKLSPIVEDRVVSEEAVEGGTSTANNALKDAANDLELSQSGTQADKKMQQTQSVKNGSEVNDVQ